LHKSAWFDGIEAALRHFGGVPEEVLLDNAVWWKMPCGGKCRVVENAVMASPAGRG
jgi:hypothetical protein